MPWPEGKQYDPATTFGPPIFDEKKRTYRWRKFTKGFSWGFLITGVSMTQLNYVIHLTQPGVVTIRQVLLGSWMLASIAGSMFGMLEVYQNPFTQYAPK